MKKKKLFNNFGSFITKNSLGFLVGLLITSVTVVAAATSIDGASVVYNGSKNFTATNVTDAINELKDMISQCPDALNCKKKLCRRATSLHTETCSQGTSTGCRADGYSSGGVITYGSKGTEFNLNTGDAFDCDVNGDGTYNQTNERFYYVTNKDDNFTYNSMAVLVYYNNVRGGVASSSSSSIYSSDTSNYTGPSGLLEQLPTKTQWKNVYFTATSRDIKDNSLNLRVSGFSYAGYAARLLTYQEINEGCYNNVAITSSGALAAKCRFLFENTAYSSSSKVASYWLENNYNTPAVADVIVGTMGNVSATGKDNSVGVRPAIEIPVSELDY